MRVAVIGAGVIGLTSAIRLREAGLEADIVAEESPVETVASSRAGAIWYPYRTSEDDRTAGWGTHTLQNFIAGTRRHEPGLATRTMVELLPETAPDPWWADNVPGFRRPETSELRPGFPDGWVIETVAIDVVPHLEHLMRRFVSLGGSLERRRITSLIDEAESQRLIVNCTGVQAGALVPDPAVYPIRGQTVRVRGGAVERVTLVERGPLAVAYVMPHGEECVLGGTTDAGEWNLVPDESVTVQIMEKAIILEPELADAEILDVRVGLRPGRGVVRLEYEPLVGTAGVIHNYGHAGNGWSLSWGCADEVARMAAMVAG